VREVILGFTRQAGVRPEASFLSRDHSRLDLKVHHFEGGSIVYAINNDARVKAGAVRLTDGYAGIRKVVGILDGKQIPLVRKTGWLEFQADVPARETRVFLLQK
jgi:hypothetical protein